MSSLDIALQPLVSAIEDGKKITIFNGAGVSTSAGIPDFRSPKTGLYSNLAKLNLPYPEAVFDIDFFRENPKAFYTLASELYPGNFHPTDYHYFLKLLHDKNRLQRVYTQNIDTLERLAGIKGSYIVEAHGSFAENHCIDCGAVMSTEELKKLMYNKNLNDGIPVCKLCKGYVKPDIVFFGESLPADLFETWEKDSNSVKVAVVAGTSLTVYPFASLPTEVPAKALRVLINKEVVGDFKHRKRNSDVVIENDCDTVARRLAQLLGWEEELDNVIEDGKKSVDIRKSHLKSVSKESEKLAKEIKDDELKDETKGEPQEVKRRLQEVSEKRRSWKLPKELHEELQSNDLEKAIDKLKI